MYDKEVIENTNEQNCKDMQVLLQNKYDYLLMNLDFSIAGSLGDHYWLP